MTSNLTPMLKQYLEIKSLYSDCILFYRLGDFYEMFFEDAVKASSILNIVLTKRNKGTLNEVKMCGIPYHSSKNYISKLLKEGLKVAICEQIGDPKLPGIVERKVVRVITPGTAFEEEYSDISKNNYIASIVSYDKFCSIAYIDLGTGNFFVTASENHQSVIEELKRLAPTEVIKKKDYLDEIVLESGNVFSVDYFRNSREVLSEYFGIKDPKIFKLDETNLSLEACGFLLQYLIETQLVNLKHLKTPQVYELNNYMKVDYGTIKNLEILKPQSEKGDSLFSVINQCQTKMGSRKLQDYFLKPLIVQEDIEYRLSGVQEAMESKISLTKVRNILKEVNDVERSIARLSSDKGHPKDLLAIRDFLIKVKDIKQEIKGYKSDILKNIFKGLDDNFTLIELLDKSLNDDQPNDFSNGGVIKKGFNEKIDYNFELLNNSKNLIIRLQENEQKSTGIEGLKIRYNKIFGYYIEVSKNKTHKVPDNFVRKQTLVNAERYTTDELRKLEESILNAKDEAAKLEYEVFMELVDKVLNFTKSIQSDADLIATLDVIFSFAYKAMTNNYCMPRIVKNNSLNIINGRHPVIEENRTLGRFVPNNLEINDDKYILLLTGPNMAGKSTYLRQTALIILLAQIGSYVPADSLEYSIVDCIFTRVGASDNLSKGESTFMVEMQESAYILHNATINSLIILDEVGRGTSTYDGLSIAWSILEYIHDEIKAKTLFATHYHELIEVCEDLLHAKNISVLVTENKERIVFQYKVVLGGVNRSYGIEVSRLAGLPRDVISRAKVLLKRLETDPYRKQTNRKIAINQGNLFEKEGNDFYDEEDLKESLILDNLNSLDLERLTPIEAINKLYELKKISTNDQKNSKEQEN